MSHKYNNGGKQVQTSTFLRLCSLVVVASLLPGCVTSPIDTGKASAVDPAMLLVTGAGAAGGAYIGNSIAPGGAGSAIGASIGAVGAGVLAGAAVQYTNRQKAEAFERGKRAARIEVMEDYWKGQTEAEQTASNGSGDRPVRDIRYERGVFQGVKYDGMSKAFPVGPYEPVRTLDRENTNHNQVGMMEQTTTSPVAPMQVPQGPSSQPGPPPQL